MRSISLSKFRSRALRAMQSGSTDGSRARSAASGIGSTNGATGTNGVTGAGRNNASKRRFATTVRLYQLAPELSACKASQASTSADVVPAEHGWTSKLARPAKFHWQRVNTQREAFAN